MIKALFVSYVVVGVLVFGATLWFRRAELKENLNDVFVEAAVSAGIYPLVARDFLQLVWAKATELLKKSA